MGSFFKSDLIASFLSEAVQKLYGALLMFILYFSAANFGLLHLVQKCHQ